MVSLKTPESPRLTRQDFASVAAYIQHLEMLVELDQMRRALNKDNRETRNLVNNLDNEIEVEPEEQLGDVGEGVQDEVEEDVEDQVEENVFTLHKGWESSKNPGKLVVGEKQQFTCHYAKKKETRTYFYYNCVKKYENKRQKELMCKASCVLIQDEDGNLQLEKTPKLEDHTHPCDVARVIKWKMMEEMHTEFLQDLTVMPSKIRKKVFLKYRVRYAADPDTWKNVIALMPPDHAIDKRLRELRLKSLGKIPTNANDIEVESLLKNLREWGGENVSILDSKKMWQDGGFR